MSSPLPRPSAPPLSQGLLDTEAAAKYLGVAEKTLRNWRAELRGPSYVKFGAAVKYRVRDLDQFIAKHVITPAREDGRERAGVLPLPATARRVP